jgi:hypothetical protein
MGVQAMNFRQLQDKIYEIVAAYFQGAGIVWSEGSFSVTKRPCVMLKLKNTNKTVQATKLNLDGDWRAFYPSQCILEVNLFTAGEKVIVGAGKTNYHVNTAVADLDDFCNYIESEAVGYMSDEANISIVQSQPVTDVTALLDGVEHEFRAMVEFEVDYMRDVSGFYGVSSDYYKNNKDGEIKFEPTPSGGRTEKMQSSEIGYFTQVEIESEDD